MAGTSPSGCGDISILASHVAAGASQFLAILASQSAAVGLGVSPWWARELAITSAGFVGQRSHVIRRLIPSLIRLGRVSSYNLDRLHSPSGSTSSSILSAQPSRRRGGRHRDHSNINITKFESIVRHWGCSHCRNTRFFW